MGGQQKSLMASGLAIWLLILASDATSTYLSVLAWMAASLVSRLLNQRWQRRMVPLAVGRV